MADIFDGKIWKNFPSESAPFFTPETANRHLGIMINLDWFQPFESSVYSCARFMESFVTYHVKSDSERKIC